MIATKKKERRCFEPIKRNLIFSFGFRKEEDSSIFCMSASKPSIVVKSACVVATFDYVK